MRSSRPTVGCGRPPGKGGSRPWTPWPTKPRCANSEAWTGLRRGLSLLLRLPAHRETWEGWPQAAPWPSVPLAPAASAASSWNTPISRCPFPDSAAAEDAQAMDAQVNSPSELIGLWPNAEHRSIRTR